MQKQEICLIMKESVIQLTDSLFSSGYISYDYSPFVFVSLT